MRLFCLVLLSLVVFVVARQPTCAQSVSADAGARGSHTLLPAGSNVLALPMLTAHNEMRKKYDVPALTWDDRLAAFAQEWANQIAVKGVMPPQHRPQNSNGENFFWGTGGGFEPKDAVERWESEVKNYNRTTNTCAPGKRCVHFTQLVWSKTTKVGCGKATSTDGKTEFFVCNYSPGGNIKGQGPFTSQPAPRP